MKDYLLKAKRAARGGEVFENRWFYVAGGVVRADGGGDPPALPENTPVIEEDFVTEPFVDAHVHLFLDGGFDPFERRRTASLSREDALERILDLLSSYKRRGIWAVRDGGDPYGLAMEAARIANGRSGEYARVLPSAGPFYKKGYYGSFLGHAVESAFEAAPIIEKAAKEGAAQVKLIATGLNSLEKAGETGGLSFSATEIVKFGEIARANGLSLMVHANGALGPVAIAAPKSIEHGFWMAKGDEELLKKDKIALTPTLVAWSSLLDHPSLDEKQKRVVAQTSLRHTEEVAICESAGVTLLAGSDAGTPGVRHVEGFFRELAALLSVGCKLDKILLNQQLLCDELPGLSVGNRAGFVSVDRDLFVR